MPAFRYKAKNSEGQSVEGVIEASDERTAAIDLQQKGYYILSIGKLHGDPRTSIARPKNIFDVFCRWFYNPIFGGATVAQLAFFYRQLASMIKSGIPLVQAMSSLRTRAGNRRLRKIANETMEYLRQGGRLSESFSRYPWMFSEMQIHLLRAGEEAGTLDHTVERIADMLDREVRLRHRLRLATLYPKILVLAVIFIPAFPVLVFQGPQAYFDKTIANIIPVALYLVVIWVLYRILYQLSAFRCLIDHLKLCLPGIGKIVRSACLARFYRVFAAMVAAGVPLSQGLKFASDSSGNSVIGSRLKKAIPNIERGQSLTGSLAETRVLPTVAIEMLGTGEQTGSVDSMLDKVAEYTENDLETVTAQSTIILGVILLLGIAAYVGKVVVTFYLTQYGKLLNQSW